MNLRNPLLLILIGTSIGIILTYSVLHYAENRTCPTPECKMRACPEPECIDDTLVTTLTDREYFDAMHRGLASANKSIHVVLYEARYYPKSPQILANRLFEDLANASRRGIDVKVLIDDSSKNKEAYEYLKNNNVNTRLSDNKTTTHAAYTIIDNKTIIIGSTTFTYYSIEKNNEANILITTEKTAPQLENHFQKNWDNAKATQ